ncbi:MAG: dCMP deaminase family protein [Succinivibrio sp.]|nr:dCMP deaminase family protein [Succinivibrio sp.]
MDESEISAIIEVKYLSGQRVTYSSMFGHPDELGKDLATALFWVKKGGLIQAKSDVTVQDLLFGDISVKEGDNPRAAYYYYLDLNDYRECYFQECDPQSGLKRETRYPFLDLFKVPDFLHEAIKNIIAGGGEAPEPAVAASAGGASVSGIDEPAAQVTPPHPQALERPVSPEHKWISRYFKIAEQVSLWSKDPSSKVGAIIVGDKGQIISQGYNGFPRGVKDNEERYAQRELKYKLVVHAEMNAILNALYNGSSVAGATLYVHFLPVCQECAKAIIQAGIARVYIDTNISERWEESWQITKTMFTEARVECFYYDTGRDELIRQC